VSWDKKIITTYYYYQTLLLPSVTEPLRKYHVPWCKNIFYQHCLWEEVLSQHRIRHQDLSEYIFRLQSRHHQLLFQ